MCAQDAEQVAQLSANEVLASLTPCQGEVRDGDVPSIGQIRKQARVFIVRVSADVKHALCVCQAIKGMRECS